MRRVLALLGAAILVACPSFPTGSSESGVRSVVSTSHTGAVLGLRYDEVRRLLFSSGDDGTVRVWDADSGTLVHTLQVTRSNTRAVAVDPASPRLAVVVTDGIRSFALSVWDWNEERQLYRIPLSEEPQFLRFSAKGTYLLYGTSSWQGLHILNASDGSPHAFHPEGFGIVAFATMPGSEDTIFSYQVSGKISYWDAGSGELTRELATVPYLSMARISDNGQVLAGYTGQALVAIATDTGSVLGRVALPSVSSLDLSAAGDELSTIAGGKLARWAIAQGAISASPQQPQLSPNAPPPAQVCYGRDGLFVGDGSGQIRAVSWTGGERLIGRNELSAITGFDALGGMLAVASQDWVRVFSSDTVSSGDAGSSNTGPFGEAASGGGAAAQAPGYVFSMAAPNPFKAPVGLTFLSPTRLLAWRRDGSPPILAALDIPASGQALPERGEFRTLTSAFRSPLSSFHVQGTLAVGVEATGVVRCVDMVTGASLFDMRVPGSATAVLFSKSTILAGRSAVLATDSSLLRIDFTTGETVDVPDPNVFTYGLEEDTSGVEPRPGGGVEPRPGGGALYTVGVDDNGRTNLLRHDGAGLERVTRIDSVPEEDLDVSLTLDPATGVLYASLGADRIATWDGSKLATLDVRGAVPLRLVARDRLLYSLNKNSTLTISDAASGARRAELSLFSDGEWCILLADGRYAASIGGDHHVAVYVNGARVTTPEDYRLRMTP